VDIEPTGGGLARLERGLFEALPASWRLPVRYRYMQARRTLEPEVSELAAIAGTGVAIDVGANHGIYSYALARLGRPVEAFEPQPWCASTLRAWAGDRVHVHEIGLSDVEGAFDLHLPVVGGVRSTGYATFGELDGPVETISVPVKTLDDFAFEGVTFIKIDVEGHEGAVLRGAAATIEAARPTVLVEVEERHLAGGTIGDVFAELLARGYAGSFRLDGARLPLDEFDVERHQRARLAGEPGAPYVNNFLFRPGP
jgi:FkbM family methyltransferase